MSVVSPWMADFSAFRFGNVLEVPGSTLVRKNSVRTACENRMAWRCDTAQGFRSMVWNHWEWRFVVTQNERLRQVGRNVIKLFTVTKFSLLPFQGSQSKDTRWFPREKIAIAKRKLEGNNLASIMRDEMKPSSFNWNGKALKNLENTTAGEMKAIVQRSQRRTYQYKFRSNAWWIWSPLQTCSEGTIYGCKFVN